MNEAKYILCSGRLAGICSKLYPVNLFRTGATDSRALLFVTPHNVLLPRNHCTLFKHAQQSKAIKSCVLFANCHIHENISYNNTNTENCCLIISTKETVRSVVHGLWVEELKKALPGGVRTVV